MAEKGSVLSLAIFTIIGSAIVVLIMMALFSSFAGPFLDMLSDQKSVKSFNRLMNSLHDSCVSGSSTVTEIALSSGGSENQIYAIGLGGPATARRISNPANSPTYPGIPDCSNDELTKGMPCTTKNSKSMINPCKASFCYCLYKITYQIYPYYGFDAVVLSPFMESYQKGASSNEATYSIARSSGTIGISGETLLAQPFNDSSKNIMVKEVAVPVFISGDSQKLILYVVGEDASGKPSFSDILAISKLNPGNYNNDDGATFAFSSLFLESNKKYYFVFEASGSGVSFYNGAKATYGPISSSIDDGASWTSGSNAIVMDITYIQESPQLASYVHWDWSLADEFHRNNTYKKIEVMQCRNLADLECDVNDVPILPSIYVTPDSEIPQLEVLGRIYPIFFLKNLDDRVESVSNANQKGHAAIAWLQPATRSIKSFVDIDSFMYTKEFESLSFVRNLDASGKFESYLKTTSSPNIFYLVKNTTGPEMAFAMYINNTGVNMSHKALTKAFIDSIQNEINDVLQGEGGGGEISETIKDYWGQDR